MIKICVAGATGRMGSTVLREACGRKEFEIVGALGSSNNVNLGKTLRSLRLCHSSVKLVGPDRITEAIENADVYISFTKPEAEMINLPVVAEKRKKIVMGTTGFAEEQTLRLREEIADKTPALFSPNFAIGVNVFFELTKSLKFLPEGYDFSIFEIHHKGKRDAPSGTATRLAEIISNFKGYNKTIHGRRGISIRQDGELELSSIRAGGVPGIHEVIMAGKHEMLKIQHSSFSRNVFAQGVLYATNWIHRQQKPGIYTMADALL